MSARGSANKPKEPSTPKLIRGKEDFKKNPPPTRPGGSPTTELITHRMSTSPLRTPQNTEHRAIKTTPHRKNIPKLSPPNTKTPVNPTPSPRRSLIPASPALHAKTLLVRLLPPEIAIEILSLAGMYHRTTFTRTRQPISYRERQIRTPQRICHLIPATLHLKSPISSVRGAGAHPLRLVKFYIRFCPANLPNARVWFEARLMRGERPLPNMSTILGKEVIMDGKVQSRMEEIGQRTELVGAAEAGDRIGIWVLGNGGLYGDWMHIPGHVMRVLVDVREMSIECFCEW